MTMTREEILKTIRAEADKKPKDPSAQMVVAGVELFLDVCTDIRRIADALGQIEMNTRSNA